MKEDSKKYTVKGMTCKHCKMNVEKAAQSVKGIDEAEVILEKSRLIVKGKGYSEQELMKAIEDAGYSFEV